MSACYPVSRWRSAAIAAPRASRTWAGGGAQRLRPPSRPELTLQHQDLLQPVAGARATHCPPRCRLWTEARGASSGPGGGSIHSSAQHRRAQLHQVRHPRSIECGNRRLRLCGRFTARRRTNQPGRRHPNRHQQIAGSPGWRCRERSPSVSDGPPDDSRYLPDARQTAPPTGSRTRRRRVLTTGIVAVKLAECRSYLPAAGGPF